MSITFEIVKFKKPTKDDLSNLHMFNPYGSIPILDDDGDSTGWNIYMFRVDDKDIQNIINSSYAVKMELPECITDYDSFFEDLGFPKEAVRNGDVRIIKSNSRYITISYGDKSKEIEKSRLEKYKVMVQTKCVVLKIKALWNSSENNLYGIDKKKAIKCIPDIENYEYVPVNNSMLAKAEITARVKTCSNSLSNSVSPYDTTLVARGRLLLPEASAAYRRATDTPRATASAVRRRTEGCLT